MKNHNKPEWVKDIEKEKIDIEKEKIRAKEKEKNTSDLLNKLFESLTVIDLASIHVNSVIESLHIRLYSSYQSPYTVVVKKSYTEHIHIRGDFSPKILHKYRKKTVSELREIHIHLVKDKYCFEFIKETDCDSGYVGAYKRIVSTQMVSLLEEKPLETDKIYDMYKWLTYRTNRIPKIGEEVKKLFTNPLLLIFLITVVVMGAIYYHDN
jgi:hypothetical protein